MVQLLRLSEDQLDRLILRIGLILRSLLRPTPEDDRNDWFEHVESPTTRTRIVRHDARRTMLIISNAGSEDAFLSVSSTLANNEGIKLRTGDPPFVLSSFDGCRLVTAEWYGSYSSGAPLSSSIYVLECYQVGRFGVGGGLRRVGVDDAGRAKFPGAPPPPIRRIPVGIER